MNSAAATTYAKAFLEAVDPGSEAGASAPNLQKLLPQVAALGDLLAAPQNVALLADPRLGPKQRAVLVKALSAHLKLPTLVIKLLGLLATNRRLGLAGEVFQTVVHLANARAGRLEVKVETAAPFTPEQVAAVKKLLGQKLQAASVELTEVTMPGLIGGFRAFAAGRVWDCSVKGRLTALAARFSHAIDK